MRTDAILKRNAALAAGQGHTCKYCGRQFLGGVWGQRRPAPYCSQTCGNLAVRNVVGK